MKSFDLQHRQQWALQGKHASAIHYTHLEEQPHQCWGRHMRTQITYSVFSPQSQDLWKGFFRCCRNIQPDLRSLTQTILIVNDSPRKKGRVWKKRRRRKRGKVAPGFGFHQPAACNWLIKKLQFRFSCGACGPFPFTKKNPHHGALHSHLPSTSTREGWHEQHRGESQFRQSAPQHPAPEFLSARHRRQSDIYFNRRRRHSVSVGGLRVEPLITPDAASCVVYACGSAAVVPREREPAKV